MAGYSQVYTIDQNNFILRYHPDSMQLQQNSQYQQAPIYANGQNELQARLNGQIPQQSQQSNKTSEKQVVDMVDAFHDATYQVGTDDPTFEAVLNDIDDNNVIEVYKAWNKYHGKEKGESFFKAFFEDATRDQLKEYGPKLARALRDRAEAAGCYDELAEDFAKIEKQFEPGLFGSMPNLRDADDWAQVGKGLTSIGLGTAIGAFFGPIGIAIGAVVGGINAICKVNAWDDDCGENIGQIFDRISETIVKAEAAAKADAAAEEEVDEEDQIEAGKKVYKDEKKYEDADWTATPRESKFDWEAVA